MQNGYILGPWLYTGLGLVTVSVPRRHDSGSFLEVSEQYVHLQGLHGRIVVNKWQKIQQFPTEQATEDLTRALYVTDSDNSYPFYLSLAIPNVPCMQIFPAILPMQLFSLFVFCLFFFCFTVLL